jgi:transcriptional regulator with XRE-family HTH domain
MPPKPTPAERLKSFRELRNLTQAELARLSGLTYQKIWALENGQRDLAKLRVDIVLRLAKPLKTTVEKLVG